MSDRGGRVRALAWLAARCDARHGVLRARLRCHEGRC